MNTEVNLTIDDLLAENGDIFYRQGRRVYGPICVSRPPAQPGQITVRCTRSTWNVHPLTERGLISAINDAPALYSRCPEHEGIRLKALALPAGSKVGTFKGDLVRL